ncbi:hypothetical protein PENSPDRAFT_188051 [Peniophora sp. CONT]|nr:hypothetical protein PENSPDRAFT_188051 [Peniophora sp. CONT]
MSAESKAVGSCSRIRQPVRMPKLMRFVGRVARRDAPQLQFHVGAVVFLPKLAYILCQNWSQDPSVARIQRIKCSPCSHRPTGRLGLQRRLIPTPTHEMSSQPAPHSLKGSSYTDRHWRRAYAHHHYRSGRVRDPTLVTGLSWICGAAPCTRRTLACWLLDRPGRNIVSYSFLLRSDAFISSMLIFFLYRHPRLASN